MAGLQWIRLDTSFPMNGKIASLVDANQHRVVVAHVSMMCHVGLTGTDGYFPEGALRRYNATKRDAQVAVESGLWVPAGGGYEIHGWDEYQPSDEAARARSERARRAAEKRWRGQNGDGDAAASF